MLDWIGGDFWFDQCFDIVKDVFVGCYGENGWFKMYWCIVGDVVKGQVDVKWLILIEVVVVVLVQFVLEFCIVFQCWDFVVLLLVVIEVVYYIVVFVLDIFQSLVVEQVFDDQIFLFLEQIDIVLCEYGFFFQSSKVMIGGQIIRMVKVIS